MWKTVDAARRDDQRTLRRLLWSAFALGAAFVTVQGAEWASLINYGLTTASSLYGSLFYTLIGCHAVPRGGRADRSRFRAPSVPPRALQRSRARGAPRHAPLLGIRRVRVAATLCAGVFVVTRAQHSALASGLVAWLAPTVAAACPACARGSEQGRALYYVATGLMLATPLLLIGALAVWLVRRSRSKPVTHANHSHPHQGMR